MPPVEISVTPKACNPRANSTMPVLSETLISACLMTAMALCASAVHRLRLSKLDPVRLHLLAQGIAVDAQHFGSVGLIAPDAVQH